MENQEQGSNLDEQTVPVYRLHDVIEAEIIENLLLAHGIRCMIRRLDDSMWPGLEQLGKWGIVKVFEKDKEKAEAIIEEYKQNRDQQPDYEF